jgi:regulatory protein
MVDNIDDTLEEITSSKVTYSQQSTFRREKNRNEHRSGQQVHEDANKIFDEAENLSAKSTTKDLLNHALRRLAQREYGEEELRRKLLSCTNNRQDVETVIGQIKQAGHLSDERFIEAYIQSRVRRGFGPLRICAELKEKGIRQDALEEVLVIWQSSWLSLAKRALEKKYGERMRIFKQNPDGDKKALMLAQKRFLLYRGFESSTIQQIFKEIF